MDQRSSVKKLYRELGSQNPNPSIDNMENNYYFFNDQIFTGNNQSKKLTLEYKSKSGCQEKMLYSKCAVNCSQSRCWPHETFLGKKLNL